MVFRSIIFLLIIFVSACANLQLGPAVSSIERQPAEADLDCQQLVKKLYMKDNYEEDLQKVLKEKKLIKFSSKFVTIQHPHFDWINKVRISLNKSIKNWNNNKYPAFYISSDEEVVTQAKQYFETINSILSPDMAVAPEATKNFETISSWVKAFENYQTEVDQLLEERISLQYNLSILKKLKIKEDVRDIKLAIKRNGKIVEEVITIRKSDKDKAYQIKRLKAEISELDGSLFKNGKIKDRIIRQAMLLDMLTILQREFESGMKNIEMPNPELAKELIRINDLLKASEFQPTTFGVYRITNTVFTNELLSLAKNNIIYQKFIEPKLLKYKEIFDAYIQNHPKDPTKIGILKRIYSKITSITPKQAALGTGITAIGAIGYDRYFTIADFRATELPDIINTNQENLGSGHTEQLERTQEENARRIKEQEEVIEVQIDELTKP
jgi:hypothetical protein